MLLIILNIIIGLFFKMIEISEVVKTIPFLDIFFIFIFLLNVIKLIENFPRNRFKIIDIYSWLFIILTNIMIFLEYVIFLTVLFLKKLVLSAGILVRIFEFIKICSVIKFRFSFLFIFQIKGILRHFFFRKCLSKIVLDFFLSSFIIGDPLVLVSGSYLKRKFIVEFNLIIEVLEIGKVINVQVPKLFFTLILWFYFRCQKIIGSMFEFQMTTSSPISKFLRLFNKLWFSVSRTFSQFRGKIFSQIQFGHKMWRLFILFRLLKRLSYHSRII